MVAAVRCPNPKCRKFMLVEEADQGKVVPCLICKQPVKVPTPGGPKPSPAAAAPNPAPQLEATAFDIPDPAQDLMPIFDDDDPDTGPKFVMN